jgi:hypothetical protein
MLVKVPGCMEDHSGEKFENWVYSFAQSNQSQLFTGYPYQIESFPINFEDPFSIYAIESANGGAGFHVRKLRQTKNADQFRIQCNMVRSRMQGAGIDVGEDFNTLVSVARIEGSRYDEYTDTVVKTWAEEWETIPFKMVIRKRPVNHYMNINMRLNSRLGRIQNQRPAVCYNEYLFGVMGVVKSKDMRKETVKMEINAKEEESKIHNPFVAENFLKRAYQIKNQMLAQKKDAADGQLVLESKYYGDQEIEVLLGFSQGIVNRITGSLLVSFDEAGKEERQVVDLGLNLKNFTKKVHIPDYVRFIAPDQAAANYFDSYSHSHGSKHVRKHWEYSEECFLIIQEYKTKFPEVVELIEYLGKKQGRAVNTLHDLYPDLEKKEAIKQIKKILEWIESLPISHLPYVEMGFDTLDTKMVQQLQDHKDYVASNYLPIRLDA